MVPTMNPLTRWTASVGLTALLAVGAVAQTSYPLLVPEGEVPEKPETLLSNVSRHEVLFGLADIRVLLSSDLAIAFSPDGKTLASASLSLDRTVRLWNVATGELIRPLEGHASMVLSVAFSPDGKILASASSDRTVRLWNVVTGELIQLVEHADGVRSVAFSPDGKTLASASLDRTVRLWNVVTGELIRTLEVHAGWVRFVAFSPDGKILASVSYDCTGWFWNVATGDLIRPLVGYADWVRTVAFIPAGKTLASGTTEVHFGERDDEIRTSRIFLGGQRGTWISCRLGGRCLRHDDGTLLFRRMDDGRFELVDPQMELQPPQLELDPVSNAIETHDGESRAVTLKVRNIGHHRAFWLRVRRNDDPGDDPLVVALPPTRAILDPGETAELSARVLTHSDYDHPVDQTSTLSLEITSLHGEPLVVPPITVRSKVPSLEWNEARWLESDGSRYVTVELTNTGDSGLSGTQFTAELSGVRRPLSTVQWQGPIAPGETITVPFGLPDDLEIPNHIRITLVVRKRQPPVHVWTFAEQPIRTSVPWALPAAVVSFLLTLTVLLLFTHPLIRRLSAEPSALLRWSPSDLPKVRTLLRLTGRLSTVLADAEVDRELLDRAIDFFRGNDADARLRRLAARLGMKPEATADAELRALPLGTGFPLNLERCLVHLPPSGRPASEVLTRLRARPETRDQITLVVAAAAAVQDTLHRRAASDLATLQVVPSGVELTELLLSPEPVRVLARIIASQVTRTRISPYQTGGGVNRDAVFFGRDDLLVDVLNREPANYLVVGGRQLGKSSLLKAIRRRLADDPRVDARYLVLSGGDLAGSLAHSLGLDRDVGLDAVLEHLGQSERRILFLIDEADALVREHRRALGGTEGGDRPGETGEDLFGRLRSLSEEGRCHFILAGFWDLYEAVALDYRSPLRNFGETLRIGALEEDACVALATVPMAGMGLGYEDGALVEHLVERTGRRANLIAIACDEILKNLDAATRTIRATDVEAALASWAIHDALDGWKYLAGEDESRLDRVVVYATIEGDAFTLAEVLDTLAGHGSEIAADRVEHSLKRLELAWVIGSDGEAFSYRVPLFVDRVRGQDPASLLRTELKKLV